MSPDPVPRGVVADYRMSLLCLAALCCLFAGSGIDGWTCVSGQRGWIELRSAAATPMWLEWEGEGYPPITVVCVRGQRCRIPSLHGRQDLRIRTANAEVPLLMHFSLSNHNVYFFRVDCAGTESDIACRAKMDGSEHATAIVRLVEGSSP